MHTYFPGVHMWSIFAIVNILMFWFLFKEKILNEGKYHSNKRPMGHITHMSKEFSCEILFSYKDSTLRVYLDVFIVISQIAYIWSKRFFFLLTGAPLSIQVISITMYIFHGKLNPPFTISAAFFLNQMNLKFWILYYFYYVLL